MCSLLFALCLADCTASRAFNTFFGKMVSSLTVLSTSSKIEIQHVSHAYLR